MTSLRFSGAWSFIRRYEVPLILAWIILISWTAGLLHFHSDWYNLGRIPDEEEHFASLLDLYAALSFGSLEQVFRSLRFLYNNYIPLAHFPQILFGWIFAPTPMALRAGNVIYLCILLVSVYKIGRFCHSRLAGLLAAALLVMMPAVYGGFRTLGLDFPLLCVIPMALYFLLRCDGFSSLKYSAFFGLSVGFAILIKGQAVLFLLCPAAFVFARSIIQQRTARDGAAQRRVLVGAGISLFLIVALTAVWWFGRLDYLSATLLSHTTGENMKVPEVPKSPLSEGIRYYILTAPLLISGPSVAALLLLLPVFFKNTRRRWEILLWLFVPLVLHMFMNVRHHRYLLPLCPAAALVIAIGIGSLRPRLRGLAAAAVAGALLVTWLDCSLTRGEERSEGIQSLRFSYRVPRLMDISFTEYFRVCGDCAYAGRPTEPWEIPMFPVAMKLHGLIRQKSPDGAGVVVHSDGGRDTIQVMITARALLPRMQIFQHFGTTSQFVSPRALEGFHHFVIFGDWKSAEISQHNPFPPTSGAR